MLPLAYRRVLALPRVRATILLMFVARLPMTMMGIAMTLHVVGALGRGFGQAGLVGAATTIGGAVGAPAVGRMIDRYGLRPVVAVCGTSSTTFWVTAPHLPYLVLVLLAVPAGMLSVPANSLTRQFLTALVPAGQRRAAFSLDTVMAEASFMGGPALIVLVTTQVSSAAALTGIGVCIAGTSGALWLTDLPTRTAEESAQESARESAREPGQERRPPMRRWLRGSLAAALLIIVGALFTLVGTEIALVAALRAHGQTAWTGVVIGMMSVASIAGGLVHGAVRRSLPQPVLALLLGALLVPVGLLGHPWWLLGLALVPMNLMCTPTLAASSEAVSTLAPAAVRGEAMGLQETATRLGIALGGPVVGFVADHSTGGWAFAAAGAGGVLAGAVGLLVRRFPQATSRHPAAVGEATIPA